MNAVAHPKDFLAGIFFLALAIATIAMAWGYETGTARKMGPGYFPLLLGGLLALLAAILIVRGIFRRGEPGAIAQQWKPVLLICSGTVLFGLALKPLGLFVSVVLLVLVGSEGSSRMTPGVALLLAIGLAAGSVLVFNLGLRLPVPAFGPWLRGWFAAAQFVPVAAA